MFKSVSLIYRYDGTFGGFLCSVFECFSRKEIPISILPEESSQCSLYAEIQIDYNQNHAQRVYASLAKKISSEAQSLIWESFHTCLPDKEMVLLRFIRMGFAQGHRILNLLTDDTVDTLMKAVKHLRNELQLLRGFIRFSECEGVLISQITPKNVVLPFLEPHFTTRYHGESFLIYDNTNHSALIYRPHKSVIVPVESFTPPSPSASERQYQRLWKRFYDTIAVEGRYNPKCQMSMMPKRFWSNMVEHQLLPDALPWQDTGERNQLREKKRAIPQTVELIQEDEKT